MTSSSCSSCSHHAYHSSCSCCRPAPTAPPSPPPPPAAEAPPPLDSLALDLHSPFRWELFACRRRFDLLIFVFNICRRFRARLLTSPQTIGLASSSRLPTTRKSNLALFGELSSTSASPVKPHKGALALTKVHLPSHQLQLYLKI